jgi:hypothetical protein
LESENSDFGTPIDRSKPVILAALDMDIWSGVISIDAKILFLIYQNLKMEI